MIDHKARDVVVLLPASCLRACDVESMSQPFLARYIGVYVSRPSYVKLSGGPGRPSAALVEPTTWRPEAGPAA